MQRYNINPIQRINYFYIEQILQIKPSKLKMLLVAHDFKSLVESPATLQENGLCTSNDNETYNIS